MALVLADRVLETCTAPGTSTVSLLGAATGYRTFISTVGNGNTTYYTIADQSGANWEVGLGTVNSGSPNTLTRNTVFSSSNGGSLTNFTSGTQNVFLTYPSEQSVYGSGTTIVAPSGAILPVTAGGTGVTSLTANYIPYGNGTSAYASSSSLQFISGVLVVGPGSTLGGTTNPYLAVTGNANSYIQQYIFNASSGTSASADFVAYPDNGSDTSGWVDVGVSSSTYADAAYTVTTFNEAYVFGSAPSGAGKSGNLVYATDSTGTTNSHQWYVGGFAQAKSAWKMQLTSTGLQLANALGVAYGGTGLTSTPTNGQIDIGNGTGFTRATISSGVGITVTNGSGTISIANTQTPGTTASAATITPTSTTAQYNVTALATGATFAVPSGSPVDGQRLTIRIKDNGTAQTLTWTTTSGGYRIIGTTLPTTTTASKVIYVGCVYNSQDTFWDVVAVATQA
jgi:hypothetical protein